METPDVGFEGVVSRRGGGPPQLDVEKEEAGTGTETETETEAEADPGSSHRCPSPRRGGVEAVTATRERKP